ncbi:MAG: tetratricopeptide repeat protein [Candidatus Omnitrophica bacterium]|nr:tetratricopeptide repeat protein [Candidatus Omnitrophota bacterium]
MKPIKFLLISVLIAGLCSAPVFAAGSNEKEVFVVAQRAFEDGFYDVSLRYIDQLFKEFPQTTKTVDARLLEGQCYFFKKQYLKAFAVFQELAKRNEYKDVTLFWLGETYLKVGDSAKAQEQYRQLIDGYVNSLYAPQAYYSLGWSYFEKGSYEDARNAFAKLVELFPSNNLAEDAAFKLGECDYNAAKYEGAIFHFNKYLTAYPNSARLAEAVFNIGESYYYLEQFDRAAEFYEKARAAAVDPRTALNAMVGRGWSLFKKNDFPAALKAFDDAQAHAKVNNFPEDDVLLGKASLFTAQEKYQDAAASYGELITRFPASSRVPESYLGRANALYLLNDFAQAIEDYKALIALPPESGVNEKTLEKARFGLAWTYLKNGNIDQSIESFKGVLERTESKTVKVSALTQIGDAYQEAGQIDKAIATYDRVLKDMPDTPYSDYVQYRLGVAVLKIGNIDAAILAFQALKANYPSSKYIPEAQYYLGVSYFKKRDWAATLEVLSPFVKAVASDNEFSSEARYLEALSLFNLKQYDKALAAFTEMQKLFPAKPAVLRNAELGIAKTKYETGNVKEALQLFEQVAARYPQSDAALEAFLWMGDHAMSSGLYSQAEALYVRILADFPGNEKRYLAHFELGRAYYAQGVLDKALEQYRNVNIPSDPELAARAKLAIAEIFTKEMDPVKAVEAYQNIIATSPEYQRDALLKIAQIDRKAAKYADELKAYEAALAAPKGVSAVKDVQLQFLLGDTYEAMNEPNKAVEAYVKVPYVHAKERDWVIKAYLRIGKIYENQEEWDKAVTAYEKVGAMNVDEAKFAKERVAAIARNRLKPREE